MDLSRGIVAEEDNGRLMLILSKEIYQKEAIMLASYKYIGECHVLIEPVDEHAIRVCFESKPGKTDSLKLLALDFCNEVLDQQVRLQLEQSYGSIRDRIVEQAFSPITKPKSYN